MLMWTVHLEGGPRRVNHAAVVVGEKIYTFGGYCTGEDYESRLPIDVHVLNTISLRWKLLHSPETLDSSIPYQRYGHTAVAYGDCAYIWGGRNDSDGACNILFCFVTVSETWSQVETQGWTPGKRDGHSACVINHAMYIFGGYEEVVDRFSDDVFRFEFSTKTWTLLETKGPRARWRDFHTAVGIGNTMYVFGGRSDMGGNLFTNMEMYCDSVHMFDTVTCTWQTAISRGFRPTGRRSHSAFTHNNCIYIFGGYNGYHDVHFKEVFKYDTECHYWSYLAVPGEGPCARRRQCSCKINSKVYIFGGTSPTITHRGNADNLDEEERVVLTDLADLHILDLDPSLKTLAQMAVLKYRLDTSSLPHDIRWELSAMTTPNAISRPINSNG
ncbi:kelch domain-containing protein 3-like [Dreissena polymorpha]|uniref:Kelch domain-containing protein 3 n=1 Tax=Dreissena polymorpha TaxID=45954 RepID=A0A9D4LA88_DREPO|nr:kelch domain-containing protein 3-like [Dreissena polymorpha]XP_052276481.1 kelch domain-containing protein 3-like [Dreissena polymorpha]KAH3854104.1 hypothetical protein DPMN_096643 [Dreissena polymorpha]